MSKAKKQIPFRGGTVIEGWPERLAYAQRFPRVRIGRQTFARTPCSDFPRCHDCAAIPGEIHVPGCDHEYCPVCRGQLWMGGCTCGGEPVPCAPCATTKPDVSHYRFDGEYVVLFKLGTCDRCRGQVQEPNVLQLVNTPTAMAIVERLGLTYWSGTSPVEIYATDDGYHCEACHES